MLRQLPNAAEISEFGFGYTGDCGETAEAAALHTLDPVKYPLTAATIKAIIARGQARGGVSANGAEPIGSIAADLASLGVPCTNYGYSEPLTMNVNWQAVLDQWGGIKPLIFEYALAGALPGDESGVHYHFNTCLAWDPDTHSGLFGDGDNAPAYSNNRLAPYTLANLLAAQPCALIVIDVVLGGSPMLDLTDATVASFFAANPSEAGAWLCAQTKQSIHGGILAFYRSVPVAGGLNGLTLLGLPLTGEVALPGRALTDGCAQRFERGVVLWDPHRMFDNPPGSTGECYLAHIDTGPFGPPPPPPPPPPVVQTVTVVQPDPATQAALDAANKKLSDLKAALDAVLQ